MNDQQLFKMKDKINKFYSSKEFSKIYYHQYKHKKPFFNFISGKIVCGTCYKSHSPFKSLFHLHLK